MIAQTRAALPFETFVAAANRCPREAFIDDGQRFFKLMLGCE